MTHRYTITDPHQEIADQIRDLEAQQAAHDAAIDAALRSPKLVRSRVELVENLYTAFGVEAEVRPRTRKDGSPMLTKDGVPVTISTDRDESRRVARLAAAITAAVNGLEEESPVDPTSPASDPPAPAPQTW